VALHLNQKTFIVAFLHIAQASRMTEVSDSQAEVQENCYKPLLSLFVSDELSQGAQIIVTFHRK